MKRIFNIILAMALLLALTACGGNFVQVDLKEPIAISEEGVIEKSILDKVKADNAIATFTGVSNNIKYEWTIFGSDITETRDINLALDLEETERGLTIVFRETENLGFPVLLSIHLNEKWTADSATAYDGDTAIYSVSITGSKTSILNMSVSTMIEKCTVLPDDTMYAESIPTEKQEVVYDETTKNETVQSDKQDRTETNKKDIYLSTVKDEDDRVYTEYSQNTTQSSTGTNQKDEYLSGVKKEDNRIYSDGNATDQDKYKTDPVPEGKPLPVEPENQEINNQKTYTCTFSIECSTILNNLKDLDPDKRELIPSNGVILEPTMVTFYEGESVFDVLQRVCRNSGIHMEASWTPIYNSAYVEGIHNLYEFDCGALSGWMYRVNGWYPNYGSSRYQLQQGDVVEWRYTCDLGHDVGGAYAVTG